MKTNKMKSVSFRIEDTLVSEMEIYKEKYAINWSAKIRNFIKDEIQKANAPSSNTGPSYDTPLDQKDKLSTENLSFESTEDDRQIALQFISQLDNEEEQILKRFKMNIKRKRDIQRISEIKMHREMAIGSLNLS